MHLKLNAFCQTHKLLLVFLVMLAVPACSTIKLAYNNAHTYTYWTLNRYLNLNTPQSALIKAELQAIHQWHRANELPRYIALLETVRASALDDFSVQKSCTVAQDVQTRYEVLTARFGQSAEKIVPTLTAAQLPHLQKAIDKANQTWRKERLQDNLDERLEKRLEQATERAENFYGKLSVEQVASIKQFILTATYDADKQYHYRLSRQAALLTALQQLQDQPSSPIELKTIITQIANNKTMRDASAYAKYTDAVMQDTCAHIARFHQTTTNAQRQHMVKQLTQYINDFKLLHHNKQ